jgi:hypothetical protein
MLTEEAAKTIQGGIDSGTLIPKFWLVQLRHGLEPLDEIALRHRLDANGAEIGNLNTAELAIPRKLR